MIKTNIKLQVTPEQLKEVQLICFSNKIYWANTGSNFEKDTVRYIFINTHAMALTYESNFSHKHKFEEIDASLFIRTKGSCVEEKKEIDLRNTWCYATVPNHDKLRLLGYNHMPAGACKKYYYIDNDNKINDFEYYPDGNQIRLNNQGEFEYATLSSQQSKSECQFTKYGFQKPDFECELLKEFNGKVLGIVYSVDGPKKDAIAFWWDAKTGKTGQSNKYYTNMYNLTPIKKPWYETCKFPCLVKDEDGTFLISEIEWYSEKYIATLTPLTNDEIEGLKQ